MLDLIKSPNLFVMQVEMDVYNLLKRVSVLSIGLSTNRQCAPRCMCHSVCANMARHAPLWCCSIIP